MSNSKLKLQPKSSNPLHSSTIIPRNPYPSMLHPQQPSLKLSNFYTKATSEFEYTDHQDNHELIKKYQTRIKNLQSGYERSKQQYQTSLKNLYKEKMILLNIISHSQNLIDEFRSKVKMENGCFKEIQMKYNIISSGIFYSQLCSNCILSITNTDLQSKGFEKEKEGGRMQESNSNVKKRKFGLFKQYSWMYAPDYQNSTNNKLKIEIHKLKLAIESINIEHSKRISDKNKEIQYLKAQILKASTPIHTILLPNPNSIATKQDKLLRQRIKQLQSELTFTTNTKQKLQTILKQSNQKLVLKDIDRLNLKYRAKFL